MNEKNIRKYAELMSELNLTALEITEDGSTVRLEMATAPAQTIAVAPAAPAVQTNPQNPAPSENNGLTDVTSPMIGVFYAAPSPESKPYVKVGDKVKPGDVLCIIEAMKLMNEITAEIGGTIEEICVKNAEVVDFGRVMFRIRQD
jgi:acetyl-CoA carboxylase biotin carboxyl carrier protein